MSFIVWILKNNWERNHGLGQHLLATRLCLTSRRAHWEWTWAQFSQEGAAWGKQHDPFFHGSDDGKVSLLELKLPNGLSWTRLADRNRLHPELEDLRQILDTSNPRKSTFIHPQAAGLLSSIGSRQALELSQESNKIRTRYGRTSFDQSAL